MAVPSAPAALLRFAEQRFDVLLVDIMMPGMDGYAFMRKIRELALPDQPEMAAERGA